MIVSCLLFYANAFTQTATLHGTTTTGNNEPAARANLHLKNSNYPTAASDNGAYTLSSITPGTYTLSVSYTGFKSREQTVILNQDDNVTLNFVLEGNTDTLQTVEVTGQKQLSYKNDYSFSAAKAEMREVIS